MHLGLPESFTSQITRQTQYVHTTKFSLRFAQVHVVPISMSKSALCRLVSIIVFLLVPTLANFNELMHTVVVM